MAGTMTESSLKRKLWHVGESAGEDRPLRALALCAVSPVAFGLVVWLILLLAEGL